jgi:hypothetical protein
MRGSICQVHFGDLVEGLIPLLKERHEERQPA